MSMNETMREFCQRIRGIVNACAEGAVIEGAVAGDWLEMRDSWLGFTKNAEYRIKDATIKVNEFEIPHPLRCEPELNTIYYMPDVCTSKMVRMDVWARTHNEVEALKRGLIHLTEHAAMMHAKAILGMNPYKDDE